MGGWTVAVFLCLGAILPCSGINTIEEMIPEIRSRLDRMRGILLPVPEDMMSEAWYLLGSYIIPLDSETELCRNHSSILFDGYLDSEMWALQMVDASGKPGSGIMHGNIMDLGNYEECIEATAPNNLFRGQHCIVETRGILPPELMDTSSPQTEALPEIRKDVMFSVCVPDSCTARDVMVHMNVALNSVNATAIMYNTSCSSAASPPLEPAEYLIILILLVMVLLIVLSTIYDNVTTKSEQKELLVSFSVTSNTSQLLSTASPQNSLPCLHGLRVFAMAWIILGHRFMNSTLIPLSSFFNLLKNLDSKAWIPWQNINLTVEIFFLLSGTLAAYNFFRDRLKGKPFRYLSFFVHRYRRLTPPLLMVSVLYATVLPRLTDGPIWRRMFTKYHEVCKETWWINLLYISNYVVPFEMCVPQTWYVEVDFQLHMLSPLLLLLIHKERTRGFLLAGVVFLASNVALMVFAFLYEVPAGGSFQRNRSTEIAVIVSYIYTHFRLTTFIIGLCLGYLLFKIKQEQLKVKLSNPQLWAGWALAALLFLGPVLTSPIFDDPQHVHKAWLDSLYVAWKRPAVGLATAWVILVCTVGRGGIVNTILSWKALIPLSRLTYCVFLVHMYLQFVQTFRTRTSLNLQTIDIWHSFFGDFVVSYLVAALLYLVVEAPCSNVFNCLFKEPDKCKEQSQNVVLPTLTNP